LDQREQPRRGARDIARVAAARSPQDDGASARFFWEDVARLNDSADAVRPLSARVRRASAAPADARLGAPQPAGVLPLAASDIPHLASASSSASLAYGAQAPAAAPRASTTRPPALVCLANVRLPGVATDLLVTLNAPVVPGAGGDALSADAQLAMLRAVLRSLRVLDWGLFGAAPGGGGGGGVVAALP
jgi:hypothetical protein